MFYCSLLRVCKIVRQTQGQEYNSFGPFRSSQRRHIRYHRKVWSTFAELIVRLSTCFPYVQRILRRSEGEREREEGRDREIRRAGREGVLMESERRLNTAINTAIRNTKSTNGNQSLISRVTSDRQNITFREQSVPIRSRSADPLYPQLTEIQVHQLEVYGFWLAALVWQRQRTENRRTREWEIERSRISDWIWFELNSSAAYLLLLPPPTDHRLPSQP